MVTREPYLSDEVRTPPHRTAPCYPEKAPLSVFLLEHLTGLLLGCFNTIIFIKKFVVLMAGNTFPEGHAQAFGSSRAHDGIHEDRRVNFSLLCVRLVRNQDLPD